MPLTSALIIVFFTQEFDLKAEIWDMNAYLVTALATLPVCLIVHVFNIDDRQIYEWILVPFALVASILWLKTSASTVVDLIGFISTKYGYNKVLLGATFLGIGNTLADFFANSSLSALGFGIMACTGSIAGQLFNLLMSIPINVFNSVKSSEVKRVEFNLLDLDEDKATKIFALMIIGLLVCQLLFLLWVSLINNFKLDIKLAKINLIIYVVCYLLFFLLAYLLN